MGLISEYVREQKRYTKDELRRLFKLDEVGLESFIHRLKSFGVLKSVKNTADQLSLSDICDDDLEITDGTEMNGACFYVFPFVGVITCNKRIIKVYPKYMISSESNTNQLERMQQIIKVLEKYERSDNQMINLYCGVGEDKKFNLLSVMLFLLRDYYEYGIYSNTEDVVELNGEGDIIWNKTIDESFALISQGRPYYTDLYTRRSIDDETDYFTQLHKYVITECSKQLKEAQLDILFGVEIEHLSQALLTDFGEKDYILDRIHKELSVQFNTRKQIVLKTIYAFISEDEKLLEDKYGFSMYGTNSFHAVWEKMCSEVFDNQLNKTLRELNLLISRNEELERVNFDFMWDGKLIEVIKKPIWENPQKDISYEATDTLIPDLISMPFVNGERQFVILDAKYYNLKLERNCKLQGNPGVGDVTKQYLYQLAYRDLISLSGIKTVKNFFLMPTDQDRIINYGVARMPILEGLGLANIQIRLLPVHKIAELYLSNKTMKIEDLEVANN